MLTISCVSYANSVPYVYGLKKLVESHPNEVIFSLDNPAICADKIISGSVDIGLVPVAILEKLNFYRFIGEFGIAANGVVQTVLLLSNSPLQKINKIHLDYQSRTSVVLLKILCKFFWDIQPEFVQSSPGYEQNISENEGGLVIGDRCFRIANTFKYQYDLSYEWKIFTQLPFVFATWVSNKSKVHPLEGELLNAFDFGVDNKMIALESRTDFAFSDLVSNYVSQIIIYRLTEKHFQAMKLFHSFQQQFKP